jgi:hypothetical protein
VSLRVLGSLTEPCKLLKVLVIQDSEKAGVGGSTPSLADPLKKAPVYNEMVVH